MKWILLFVLPLLFLIYALFAIFISPPSTPEPFAEEPSDIEINIQPATYTSLEGKG